MAVTTYTEEFTSAVSPARLFKAIVTESHVFIPKAVPGGIKNVEFLEGDGGAGSIKQTNLVDGGKLKFMKHRIDVVDVENLYTKYTLVGCDVEFEKIESVVYEIKFEAAPGGGCVCKMTSEYHVKAGYELKVEEVKEGKLKASGLFKAVEEYLVAHPEECA
ncbi:hypothetical protein MLD38_038840 [Melastoma candidum]|uniref:Uncharacterized protein n=1 Tax=Melastoma candidum TaxID=119954 RepID=A0ACB9L2H9_9MYRT|nr:hypothetical protein MLD38_038840 [Melastoma candidum]